MIRGTPIMNRTVLAAAKANAKARCVPLRQVSRMVYGNSGFFGLLSKRQATITTKKYDAVMAWFDDPKNWPDGIVPPEVVDLFAKIEMKESLPCP